MVSPCMHLQLSPLKAIRVSDPHNVSIRGCKFERGLSVHTGSVKKHRGGWLGPGKLIAKLHKGERVEAGLRERRSLRHITPGQSRHHRGDDAAHALNVPSSRLTGATCMSHQIR